MSSCLSAAVVRSCPSPPTKVYLSRRPKTVPPDKRCLYGSCACSTVRVPLTSIRTHAPTAPRTTRCAVGQLNSSGLRWQLLPQVLRPFPTRSNCVGSFVGSQQGRRPQAICLSGCYLSLCSYYFRLAKTKYTAAPVPTTHTARPSTRRRTCCRVFRRCTGCVQLCQCS